MNAFDLFYLDDLGIRHDCGTVICEHMDLNYEPDYDYAYRFIANNFEEKEAQKWQHYGPKVEASPVGA